MSGRWTRIAAAVGLAVVLGGCNPTAAPSKKGSAAEPLRRSASRVTRGTDRMVRGATGRVGNGKTTGNRGGMFGMFSASNNRTTNMGKTGTGMGTGTGMRRAGTGVNSQVTPGMTPGTVPFSTSAGNGAARTGADGRVRGETGAATSRRPGNLFGSSGMRTGTGMSAGSTTRTGSGMKNGTGMRIGAGMSTGAGMKGRSGTTAGAGKRMAGGTMGGSPLHVIGFFTEDASSAGLTALGRDPKALSYLSPWWYSIKADGSLVNKSTAASRAWVKSHNVPVMPLVTNGGEYAVLQNSSAMQTAVKNIVAEVQKNNYAGINVDFQGLPSTTRSGLTAFVDDLTHSLHAINKVVSVDIIPTQAQTGSGGAYDEVSLGRYADQIVLMTYDHHDDSSKPGPVSPHDWVVAAVQHTLQSGVPASKIVLGVNDYGYDWNTSNGSAVTMPQKVATTFPSSQKSYDSTTKEVKVTYTKNGQSHIIYYGGREALKDKVAIAKQYKLYGIAIWRVGYEDAAYWQTLVQVNGDAASLQSKAGATSSSVPSAGYSHKAHGTKPMTHRPIGTKSGRTSGAKAKKGAKKAKMMKSGKHGGTSRSNSGKKRGAK